MRRIGCVVASGATTGCKRRRYHQRGSTGVVGGRGDHYRRRKTWGRDQTLVPSSSHSSSTRCSLAGSSSIGTRMRNHGLEGRQRRWRVHDLLHRVLLLSGDDCGCVKWVMGRMGIGLHGRRCIPYSDTGRSTDCCSLFSNVGGAGGSTSTTTGRTLTWFSRHRSLQLRQTRGQRSLCRRHSLSLSWRRRCSTLLRGRSWWLPLAIAIVAPASRLLPLIEKSSNGGINGALATARSSHSCCCCC